MAALNKIMIAGAGTMGAGIAQTAAAAGFKVYLVDLTEELLDRARKILAANIDVMISAGLYTDRERYGSENNIEFIPDRDMEAVADSVDLVFETVFERPDIKQSVFAKLDRHCRPDCIFCSGTSASDVFSFVNISRKERFLITHWFNPAYLMRLVEVVRGPETSNEVVETVKELLIRLGKKPCVMNRYVPGFIVNRLANALCREAGYMITQGWVTAEEIDEAIKATNGMRYAFEGPMALFDIVGWDLILTGCRDVFPSLCNASDTSEFAETLVKEQKLGLKAGSGVYDYDTTEQEFLAERSKKIIKMHEFLQTLQITSDACY